MNKEVIEKEIAEIELFINKKQFVIAEKKARGLIKALNSFEPEQYEGYIKTIVLLSEILSKSMKTLLAWEELEKNLKEFPFEEKLLYELYNVSVKLKRFQKAETALKSLISINPSDIGIRLVLSKFYIALEENTNAIVELNKILGLGVYDVIIHNLLASCYLKAGLFSKALEHIRISQNIMPDDSSLVIQEAKILIMKNCFNEAYELINELLLDRFENSIVNTEFISIMVDFSDLYIKVGQKSNLVELIIKVLNEFTGLTVEDLQNLENLSKKIKTEVIFNFFVNHNKYKILFTGLNELEIIRNIIYLVQNKTNFATNKFSIKTYFESVLEKLISDNFKIFVHSVVYLNRTVQDY